MQETNTAPSRELSAEELKQVGGGTGSEWRYVPVRRFS